jgi:hypothetical protein
MALSPVPAAPKCLLSLTVIVLLASNSTTIDIVFGFWVIWIAFGIACISICKDRLFTNVNRQQIGCLVDNQAYISQVRR